jgi:group I intron endonuclease
MSRSGVYAIHCKGNGMVYIGSSVDIESRCKNHFSNLESGNHGNKRLQTAWDEYGADAFDFSIVTECDPKRNHEVEKETINGYDPVRLFNIGTPGRVSYSHFRDEKECKKRTFYMRRETHRLLKIEAIASDETPSDTLDKAIRFYIAHQNKRRAR